MPGLSDINSLPDAATFKAYIATENDEITNAALEAVAEKLAPLVDLTANARRPQFVTIPLTNGSPEMQALNVMSSKGYTVTINGRVAIVSRM